MREFDDYHGMYYYEIVGNFINIYKLTQRTTNKITSYRPEEDKPPKIIEYRTYDYEYVGQKRIGGVL